MDRIKRQKNKLHSYKTLYLTVAIMLLSGFCACKRQEEGPLIYITQEELMSYQKEVELTNENWKEYFELVEDNDWKMESEASKSKRVYLKLKRGFFALQNDMLTLSFTVESQMEKVVTFHKTGEILEQSELVTEELQVEIGQEQPKVTFYESEYRSDSLVVDETGEPLLDAEWSNPLTIITASIDRRKTPQNIMLHAGGDVLLEFSIPEEKWNTEEEGVRYLCVGNEGDCFRIYELGFCDDVSRYLKKQTED